MPKYRMRSLMFSMDKVVEYEDIHTNQGAKERFVEGIKDEVGPVTARTMARQVKVERIDDGNNNNKKVE